MARRANTSRQTLLLFKAFLERQGDWRYGYDLSRETGLKSGTLYPALMRLEEQGLLETRWEEPAQRGRPPRHMYRLNGAGAVAAKNALSAGEQRTSAMRPPLRRTSAAR
jgi:PadR family transcriptional regulator, regulatory protein PadR